MIESTTNKNKANKTRTQSFKSKTISDVPGPFNSVPGLTNSTPPVPRLFTKRHGRPAVPPRKNASSCPNAMANTLPELHGLRALRAAKPPTARSPASEPRQPSIVSTEMLTVAARASWPLKPITTWYGRSRKSKKLRR